MDRLKGLASFLVVAAVVLVGLRVLHLGAPVLFPVTRPGPHVVRSLEEARGRLGFTPFVPAYRPATLGAAPPSLTVTLAPHPTFLAVWRGEHYLAVTQRLGGPKPPHPPTAQRLSGVNESLVWPAGPVSHMILRRGEFWIVVETDLPWRDLRRIADTLGRYSAGPPVLVRPPGLTAPPPG